MRFSWPFRGRSRLLLAGALFALVGGLFLVIGVADGWSTHSFLSRAEHVEGVVTGSERGESCSSRHHHHCHAVWSPAVDFVVDGHTYSFVDDRSDDSASAHPVGEHVTVAYDPDRPGDARILRKGLDNYFLALIFGGLGILFVPVGLVLVALWLRGRSHT